MAIKKKYSWGNGPLITRVKLNPEQAVLGCTCYRSPQIFTSMGGYGPPILCPASPGNRGGCYTCYNPEFYPPIYKRACARATSS